MDSLAKIVEEVVKHLPGQHDQQSQAGNKDTHEEYMALTDKISATKGSIQSNKQSIEMIEKRVWRKQNGVETDYDKTRLQELDKNVRKFSDELSGLIKRKKELEKFGKHSHPEYGQFTRIVIPEKERQYGQPAEYVSPSGFKVSVSHFGGWPMQRVAPSSTVETSLGRMHWRGQNARTSANKFLSEIFGIDAGYGSTFK